MLSPSDDTPTAATVGVLPLPQISRDTPPVVRATVAAVGVSSHGL